MHAREGRRVTRTHARVRIGAPSAPTACSGAPRSDAAAKARHSEPPSNNAPAMREMNATTAMSPTQWPAGCAPKTGSVAGYGMRPASAESCAVWLLLLRGCELAAVGAGISAGEGGSSSRLRRAAFSSWRLLAVRSNSSSFPARASARASLAAKESAH